jgi:hypothetical protein
METRLVTISSQHDEGQNALQNNTNFTVALGNHAPDLRTDVRGFSVESASFVNLCPNVRPGQNTLTLYFNVPGSEVISLTIEPGYYNMDTLALALNDQIALQVPLLIIGQVSVSVAPGVGVDGGDRLRFYFDGSQGIGFEISISHEGLGYQCGIPQRDPTVRLASIGDASGELLFRTRLLGENALQLHTKLLSGSRMSLNGLGASVPTVMTLPINVQYGALQSVYDGGAHMPTTLYGPHQRVDLNLIDVSLRYLDGELADCGDCHMHVTFRVWLRTK